MFVYEMLAHNRHNKIIYHIKYQIKNKITDHIKVFPLDANLYWILIKL